MIGASIKNSIKICKNSTSRFNFYPSKPANTALVLQPIVENIFKHAFNDTDYKGKIEINALREADKISITILDDGAGFSSDDIFERSLGNIKKRIMHFYHNAQFIAENRTPPEKGAMVMIVFSVDSKLDKE